MLQRKEAFEQATHEFYVEYLSTQLELSDGSEKEAARRSGIMPQSFSRLCRDHGVPVGKKKAT
jgi:DNA-binding NtrC family response regulator